jgi:hypothetical protein
MTKRLMLGSILCGMTFTACATDSADPETDRAAPRALRTKAAARGLDITHDVHGVQGAFYVPNRITGRPELGPSAGRRPRGAVADSDPGERHEPATLAVELSAGRGHESSTCRARYANDVDNDGNADAIGAQHYSRHDTALLTYSAEDDDADGTFERATGTDYDRRRRPFRFKADTDGDGTWDSIVTRQYDRRGNITFVSVDRDGDGDADRSETAVYDAHNTLLFLLGDDDGDGDFEWKLFYVFDSVGNWLGTNIDLGIDGTIDYVPYHVVFDANSNVLLEEYDFDGDGTVDNRTTFQPTVAADGTVVTLASFDFDADGSPDARWRYTFPHGNYNHQIYEIDDNLDGNFESWTEVVLDDLGRVTREANDWNLDGALDYEKDTTYLGDEDKVLTDVTVEGGTSTTKHVRYDNKARPLSSRTRAVENGTVVARGSERWTYVGNCR